MSSIGKREPAVLIGLIVGFVATTIALIVAFGVELTVEQQGAIMATVTALAAIVQAFLTRGQVYAPNTVARIEDQAVEYGIRTQAEAVEQHEAGHHPPASA